MKIKIALLFSLFPLAIFSQNITGKVVDSDTQEAVVAAHVYIDDATATITNVKGEFQLAIDSKNTKAIHIFISHLGYVTQKVEISKLRDGMTTVYLIPDQKTLNKVVINSEKKLNAKVAFTELTPMKRGLHSFATEVHNGKIYIIGGDLSLEVDEVKAGVRSTTEKFLEPTFNDFVNQMAFNPSSLKSYSGKLQTYDIANNQWETSDLKFRKRAAHNLHVYKDDIYVIGGKRMSRNNTYLDDVIEIYNLKSNSITTDDVNPHQAVDFMSFLYNDYIIALGGIKKITKKGIKEYSKDIHFYNLKSGFWYKLGEMPNAKETQGVLVNDMLYLVGGFNKKPLKTIESFNLKTGEWHVEGELFDKMRNPALASHRNFIYVYDRGKLLTYDTVSKELNEYWINLEVAGAELLFDDNMLYIIGGYTTSNFYTKPSKKIVAINIDELSNTKVRNSKKTQRKTNS
jgi:hypothetical protein